ncbi:signal peptidase complex-like protein DTM1 [Cornus florida]|uniref:signal peptidase complex-like protein DTM1 n=1 Tax=Cornus florida TaxID=4283 RepID=UPI00289EB2CB|nr:signal peptidase complex-like protein DTM1 [Cornus florida]
MANDAALRSSLVWLALVLVLIGLYTQSWKKMLGTYLFGICGIAGVLLPDWEYFDRPVSQWCTPLSLSAQDIRMASLSHDHTPSRFRFYPARLVIYTVIYGFALYKWWMFISS